MAGRPQFAGLVEQPIGAGTFEEGLHAAPDPALHYPMTIETCTECGKPTHPTESNDNGECAICSRACETCNGTGTDPDLDEVYEGNCLECNGEGTIERTTTTTTKGL